MPKDRPKPKQQALKDRVAESLDLYLESLNGDTPTDLYRIVLEQVEQPLLESVMRYCDGNQSRASEVLGLNRGTLRKKLRAHDLHE